MEGLYMTDHQYDSILEMVILVMDGCKDLDEAKQKIKKLQRVGKKEVENQDSDEKEDEG